MRGLRREINIRCDINEAWDRISRLTFCRKITESFFTGGRRLEYLLIRPEDEPTRGLADEAAVLPLNTKVQVTTKRGKPWVTWRVTRFDPPGAIAFTAAQTRGWLNPYFSVVEIRLENLGDGMIRASARLNVIFFNRLLEVVSLFMPTGLMYGVGLNRVLKYLRRSSE